MGNLAPIQHGQALAMPSSKASAARLLEDAFESLLARSIKAIGPTGKSMSIPVAWPRGRSPSNEEKTGLTRILASIHAAMQTPATEDEMVEHIDMLIHGRAAAGGPGGEVRGKVYALVLADVPGAILKLAIQNILRGKAEGIPPTFLPSTDMVLGYCERLQRDVMAKAVMVERMLALKEEDQEDEAAPLTDEQREKIARIRELSQGAVRKPPALLAPTVREHGPSPAARIAEETAARATARETQA